MDIIILLQRILSIQIGISKQQKNNKLGNTVCGFPFHILPVKVFGYSFFGWYFLTPFQRFGDQ
jgi:hypothetical protein